MYLIVGLGNPEEEYSGTRHNMGFDVINKVSGEYDIKVNKSKFNSLYGTGTIEGQKIILVKPQTYMNLSGKAVRDFANFYKIPLENVIIIYDDLDIQPSSIRIRKKGEPGSHNGIKSVTHELGTEEFPRIRVGIGKPEFKNDLINYVIAKISDDEYKLLEEGIDKAKKAVIAILKEGIDKSMNLYN